MALNVEWFEAALRITGGFETNGDPFAQVAGDFDGQGISLGVLQWSLGQGTLQPLVKEAGRSAVTDTMTRYGAELWQAATGLIPQGLAVARAWQSGYVLKPDVKAELTKFACSKPMREAQKRAAASVAASAMEAATKWAKDRGLSKPTKKEFCWFFDLVVQNGGLKGLTLIDVRRFIDHYGPTRVDDAICDWLAARPSGQAGWRDSRKNGEFWRDKIGDDDLDLFVLSYLRSLKSASAWAGVVLNRKATVALTKGWVNGEQFDLKKWLS